MLKTTELFDEPTHSRNNSNRVASSKDDRSKLAFRKNDSNNKVDRFTSNSMEYVKKSRKLKGQKLSKSQKLAKSRKKVIKKWEFI